MTGCVGCNGDCPLRTIPALKAVPERTWKEFLRLRSTRSYERGNILFYEGNQPLGMFFLCAGRVKIVKSDGTHRAHIARVVTAPDLLGDRSFIAGQPYIASGEVMEDSRVCFLAAADFERIFLGEPSLYRELARRFARELGDAEEKARDLALKTIRSRLAKNLLEHLEAARGEADLNLKESRHELAEILGTSPEAISRTFAEFKEKGLVSGENRSIRILDAERLRRIAEL